jgi:hypothetical protein
LSCHDCHDIEVTCHGDSDTFVTASVTLSRIEQCHGVTLSRDTFLICHGRGGPVRRGYVFAVLHISKGYKEGVDRTTETC